MPDLSVSETQRKGLEAIREELESAYVGEYGTVRMEDTIQYLLDTYTPPEATDDDQPAVDIEGLTAIDGVGEATAKSLAAAGFHSIEDVASAAPAALTEIKGIGDEQAVDIVAAATDTDPGEGTDNAETKDTETDGSKTERDGEESPENTLQQAMSLLDAHDDRWRESDSDEPYEVDLPGGSTEAVRTKDDIKRLLFKHWR